MERRNVLKTLVSGAFGAGLLSLPASRAWAGGNASASPRPPLFPRLSTRDGVPLFHKDWGEGRPVVFVHSWANHSDLWQYQMVHLAERGFRCVAYDQRGHGRSGDAGRGYDFDTLADDLASVLEGLDLRDAVLVGHSMASGQIVRYLSRHGSRRVARVLLAAPTTPFLLQAPENPDGIPKAAFERVRAALAADFPKWLAENTPPFFAPETSAALMQWGISMSHQASFQAVLATHRSLTETDFRPDLRKVAVPVLVLHGDRDRSAPLELTGRRTAGLVPGAELRVYEGAPHGLLFTHMERFNRDLLGFAKG